MTIRLPPTPDVANAQQVAEVCGHLLKGIDRLDVLVNAAGILRMGATDELSLEAWQQTFAVNVGGAFNLFQQTMGQFRRQQGGAIVTVASDAAHTPRIGMNLRRLKGGAEKSGADRGPRAGGQRRTLQLVSRAPPTPICNARCG